MLNDLQQKNREYEAFLEQTTVEREDAIRERDQALRERDEAKKSQVEVESKLLTAETRREEVSLFDISCNIRVFNQFQPKYRWKLH